MNCRKENKKFLVDIVEVVSYIVTCIIYYLSINGVKVLYK